MAEAGESFQKWVGGDEEENGEGENDRPDVFVDAEECGGGDEGAGADEDDGHVEQARERGGGEGAILRAGVGRVELGIDQAVHRHGHGAGGDHAEEDEEKFSSAGPAVGGDEGGQEGEGESEEGVGEFDVASENGTNTK